MESRGNRREFRAVSELASVAILLTFSLGAPAIAQDSHEVVIDYSDLDLLEADDNQELDQRIRRTVANYCRGNGARTIATLRVRDCVCFTMRDVNAARESAIARKKSEKASRLP